MASVSLLGGAVACGSGSSGKGSEVDVPVGLTVQCARAFDAGMLPLDGTWRQASLASGDCVIYGVDTVIDHRYVVELMIAPGGEVDFVVSSNDEFEDLAGAGYRFGDDPEVGTFESTSGGRYSVALIGRSASETSIRILPSLMQPAHRDACSATVDGGELASDGTTISDIVFPHTCLVYRFEGLQETIHRLTYTLTDGGDVWSIAIARDSEISDILSVAASSEPPVTWFYPVTETSATHYVLLEGGRSDVSYYDLALERGNAPIGLVNWCFRAEQKGPLTKDWTPLMGSLPAWECHIYTLSGSTGSQYITALTGIGPVSGGIEFRIASDPDFRNVLMTESSSVEGIAGQAFTAAAAQTYYVAVLTTADQVRDYNLRGFETLPAPPELDYWCGWSTLEGALVAGAAPIQNSVISGECATYTLAVSSGVRYALLATPAGGQIALFAAEDPAHTRQLGSSSLLTGSQGFSFVAPTTGDVHVVVAGRSDDTAYSLQAVPALAAPSGLSDQCSLSVDRGSLSVDAEPVADFAPADHCSLYSFAGRAGVSYTVRVTNAENSDPDLVLASNASFTSILSEQSTPGSDTIVFTAAANQTFYLAVHGFQRTEYAIEVLVSPPPPAGLSGQCSSLFDGGALGVGDDLVTGTAATGQCAVYSLPASSGTPYTITFYTLRGDPDLTVARDAAFSSIVTDAPPYTFTASATGNHYLAVFPAGPSSTEFQLAVTSP